MVDTKTAIETIVSLNRIRPPGTVAIRLLGTVAISSASAWRRSAMRRRESISPPSRLRFKR
jgi:hypothetical protein